MEAFKKIVNHIGYFLICFIILIENFSLLKILDQYFIKHILIISFLLLTLIYLIFYSKIYEVKFSSIISREAKLMLILTLILFLISIVRQIYYEKFGLFTFKQLYFLIVPIFVSSMFSLNRKNIRKYVNIIFFSTLFCFLYFTISNGLLNAQNIAASFNLIKTLTESITPIETNMGQLFLLCFVFYLYDRRYILAIITSFFVILSSKRMSIVFLFLTPLFFAAIALSHYFKIKRKPLNNYKIISLIIIFAFGFGTMFLYNLYLDSSFGLEFYMATGLDLTKFSMSRDQIFTLAMSKGGHFAGLGAVTNILEEFDIPGMTNLHNDILMLYMDCGFIGMTVFLIIFIKMFKVSKYSLFLCLYLFVELFTAHYLGSGGIVFFSCFYIITRYFNYNEKNANDKILPKMKIKSSVGNYIAYCHKGI